MCLVAQVVGAPVQCSEGCEQHNLAISLSVHFPMAVCLAFSVWFFALLTFLYACFARLSSISGGKCALPYFGYFQVF